MGNSIPIVIIVIGVLLVLIALLVWTKRKEVKLELERINDKKKKAFFAQWIIGIVLALLAAIFMFDGDILGENNAGISTIIGIVGISLIASSSIHLIPFGRK